MEAAIERAEIALPPGLQLLLGRPCFEVCIANATGHFGLPCPIFGQYTGVNCGAREAYENDQAIDIERLWKTNREPP
jgi:hypothetical protein